jgi:DNA-binding Lrp family transcriptional regulator
MKAYILIKIRTGDIQEVIRQLRRVNGVVEANMTFGPFDAVAIVEAGDTRGLGRIIGMEIQTIPGITDTLTCLAVEI